MDNLATGRTQTLSSTISVIQYKREGHRPIPPDHKSANTRDHDHMGLSRFLKKRTRAAPRTLFEDRGRRQGAFWVRFLIVDTVHRRLQRVVPCTSLSSVLQLNQACSSQRGAFWFQFFGLPRSSSTASPDSSYTGEGLEPKNKTPYHVNGSQSVILEGGDLASN